jgi:peptidoglycan glycosyltransferase
MKKVTRRAISALIIAVLVIAGVAFYGYKYVKSGASWASYFGSSNVTGTSTLTDRSGVVLATEAAGKVSFSSDYATRVACYHVVGDLSGNVGTGALSMFSSKLAGFDLVNGTTRSKATDLALTIDSQLNITAYNALAGRKGAVLVCNYKTGEILCMVSSPSQDPANPSKTPADGTYLNKCISSTLTPGSVFKLVTLTAAVENVSDLYKESYNCAGSVTIAGVKINCTGTHGKQTVEQALANSCNCAFAQIAQEVGPDTLAEYADKLGFTSQHSLDGIKTAAGSFVKADAGTSDLSWSGIGQYKDLVCPYSMLRLVSAIGNGGELVEPTLLGHSKLDGTTKLLSADTAQKMKEFMSYDVQYSYGKGTFPGLAICAKSGTAEVGDGNTHAWFTGFLDDDEHPYAFVVVVENGGGGLRQAGPIANAVLQAAAAKY